MMGVTFPEVPFDRSYFYITLLRQNVTFVGCFRYFRRTLSLPARSFNLVVFSSLSPDDVRPGVGVHLALEPHCPPQRPRHVLHRHHYWWPEHQLAVIGTNGVLPYLEGKMQLKNISIRINQKAHPPFPDYQWRDLCSRLRNRFCKSRETSRCFPCWFKNGGSARRNRTRMRRQT